MKLPVDTEGLRYMFSFDFFLLTSGQTSDMGISIHGTIFGSSLILSGILRSTEYLRADYRSLLTYEGLHSDKSIVSWKHHK